MIIRKERPGDKPAIRAVVSAAFSTEPNVAELVDLLRTRGDAEISLVAVQGGDLIGHVMLSRMRADLRALGLAPLAVHPAHQRRGIGSVLVSKALEHAANAFWEIVFVLGDPAFYGRFGFDLALARGFISPYAGPHFMACTLGKTLRVNGGAVDYPSAFAELGA
jgi:putative acetyltransferase